MMLSDRDIKYLIHSGEISISPDIDMDVQLQPASVDLRLSKNFRRFKHGFTRKVVADWTDQTVACEYSSLRIYPEEFMLGSTMERISLPDDIVARVEGRSSVGRAGLIVHVTAGFIDPGFDGQITLELYNLSRNNLIVEEGMRICQISFEKLSSRCERPYGSPLRKSKYQHQLGVVAGKSERVA